MPRCQRISHQNRITLRIRGGRRKVYSGGCGRARTRMAAATAGNTFIKGGRGAKDFGLRLAANLGMSKTKLDKDLKKIYRLRDNVAHTNDYAAISDAAKAVCGLVRHMLELQQEFATEVQGPGIGNRT